MSDQSALSFTKENIMEYKLRALLVVFIIIILPFLTECESNGMLVSDDAEQEQSMKTLTNSRTTPTVRGRGERVRMWRGRRRCEVVYFKDQGQGDRRSGLEKSYRLHCLHHRGCPYCLLLSSCLPLILRSRSFLASQVL